MNWTPNVAPASPRPAHETNCESRARPESEPFWWCDCRMRSSEYETHCNVTLGRCGVCHALTELDSHDNHLDWHWERGDFS